MNTNDQQNGTPHKGKGGRPRKAISKSAVLVVRLTPDERTLIEQKAAQAGIKTGEWFRKAAGNAVVQSRFTPEEMAWLRSLAGACNNLNQLTKLAHRDGLASVALTLRSLLKDIAAYMNQLKNHGRKTD